MSIQNLKIHNFRSIEKLELTLEPETKVLCLVGENGSAKTSVLTLIAEALISQTKLNFPDFSSKNDKRYRLLSALEIQKDKQFYSVELNYKGPTTKALNFKKIVCLNDSVPKSVYSNVIQGVELRKNQNSQEMSSLSKLTVQDDYLSMNLLLIRPSDRYEKDGYTLNDKNDKNDSNIQFSVREKYKNEMPYSLSVSHSGKALQTIMLDMIFDATIGYKDASQAFNSISRILKQITGKDFGRIQVNSSPYRSIISSTLGDITSFSQGELDLLVTISSILSRQLFLFNSYSEEQRKNHKINIASKIPGIVMIDELDLHLHPRAQEKYIKVLTDVFPNIQFVITTHSPFIVRGLPSHSKVVNLPSGRVFNDNFQAMDIDSITNIIFCYDGGFSEEVNTKFHKFKKELVSENPNVELLKTLYRDLSTSDSAKNELGLYLASYATPELVTLVKEI